MNNKTLTSIKKITSSMLAVLMLASSFVFAPAAMAVAISPTLTIDSQLALNGNQIIVPITGTNFTAGEDITGLQFRVNYNNTLLSYTGFTPSTTGVTTVNNVGNYVTVLWDHSSALTLNNETFVSLKFNVISGSAVDANLNHSNEVISNSAGEPVTISFVDGIITLNPAATLSSIAITSPANKLTYTVGDSLDITGLVVTGTYDDTSTKVETVTTANITGFDSSAVANDQVLTITVGGKTTTYTIDIVAPLSSAKNITSFSFLEGSGVITGTNISVSVPFGTNVTALVPTIVISPNASVDPASGVAQNFTNPVTYIVTAENSSTQTYTVTVNVSANPNIALLAADKEALVDNSIKGANANLSNITLSLTNPLPANGANGSTITWESSNPAVVSNDGQIVNRPAFVASNATITLTATLTKGGLTDTKAFTLIVIKLPASTVATLTSGAYTVSAGGTNNETIINVPFGTAKADFLSALTKGNDNQVWDSAGIDDPVVTGNTLKVIAQDGTTKVTYTITVSNNPDIAKVTADRDALVDDAIKGGNADLLNITLALTDPLPSIGNVNGSTITWASSNPTAISNDGQTINRPAFADGNTIVTLTATLTKGLISQTKAFTLIVLKLPASTVATLTSGTYTVSEGGTDSETIINVPFGTSKAAFLAALTKDEAHQTWDSTGVADPVVTGNTLKVTAQDSVTEVVYTVTVAPDVVDPTGSISNVTEDSYFKGTVTINATASDVGSGVEKVEFWYASIGTKIGEDTTAPYSIDWNTTKEGEVVPEGIHSLFIKVYDKAGNSYQSAGISITVDNTAPTVTKLGDNSTDLVLSIGDTDLVFSEVLSNSSKTAVQNALTAGADGVLTYSWTGATLKITATAVTTFANDVIVNVSDLAGNPAELLLVDSSLTATQTTPNGAGAATVDSTTPQVVITNPTQAVTITVDSGTTNPTIDVGSFISGGTGTIPSLIINSNIADVAISADTTVTSADSTWDGVITAPTATTVTLPEVSGETRTLGMAIEVGFTGAKLSFDKGVRLLLPGQAGKRAGYVRTGTTFTEITNTCGADNQATGDALAIDGDCKISVGSDLVIWTKHFTSFASFSSVINGGSGGGGGGGGGGHSSSKKVAKVSVDEPEPVEEVAVELQSLNVAAPFTDIEGHWAATFIDSLRLKGIINGKSEGKFEPDSQITRAELVKIVVNLYGITLPESITEKSFSDVETTEWYAPFIAAAKTAGIIDGYTDGTFQPNQKISRVEALKILLEASNQDLTAESVTFPDTDSGEWYAKYINYAKSKGLIEGYKDGTFGPNKKISRAEFAKLASMISE